jgi:general stress protein 26
MKSFKKISFLFFIVFFLFQLESFCQNRAVEEPVKTKIKTAAQKIMTSAGTCTLITLDENGNPRAREMDAFLPETDFTVWFGTTNKSRKVNQIKNDKRVTLYYLDSDRSGYVTISGEAQIITDSSEKEKRWKEKWKDFYPNKNEDYVLIKVAPIWMEVVSDKYGIVGDPISWAAQRIYFDRN